MKNKAQQRAKMPLGQQSSAYAVGQVSGSLFQQSSEPSGSLSALFRTALPGPSALFQPVRRTALPGPSALFQPVRTFTQKTTGKEEQQKVGLEVKVEVKQKKQQQQRPKKTPVAEQELLNRESSLLTADTDEHVHQSSMKRKRRASETGGETSTEHWVMKRQKLKANRQEEALKNKRTVFVGNLPTSCTLKTLRGLFKDKGPIESVRFRSVVREDPSMSRKEATIKRKVHPEKQSINAYVVFKNEEGVAKALERNGVEIEEGFHIRVDRVTDSSSHDHKRSVFVGNLAFDIKELAFRRHFEECGKVEAVRLVRDPNSGLGKGFGYVLFESADSVEVALVLDGSKLEGRSIRVKRSVKKEKQTNKSNGKANPRNAGRNAAQVSGGIKKPRQANFKSEPSGRSFKGEMANPNKKRKKALKKKTKTKQPHRASTK